MARTKRDQGRQEKHEEIISAARELFLGEGYDTTSMSRLAKHAGVAPNTIYWYFKDKDELLVAVASAELSSRMEEYSRNEFENIVERLLWVINQFEGLKSLINTVHARMQHSQVVEAWHEQFHLLSESILRTELELHGVSSQQMEARLKIAIFAVEGMLSHPIADGMKRDICHELVRP